jgi:hypothetical protein
MLKTKYGLYVDDLCQAEDVKDFRNAGDSFTTVIIPNDPAYRWIIWEQ